MTIKAHAKVNIFLKIVGTKEQYHLLSSRFMRVENLYDTLSFVPLDTVHKGFTLNGNFGCKLEQNTIYKAYRLLLQSVGNPAILKDFFKTHAVTVKKRIPEFAGLGGGSSDAAAFLRLADMVCDLRLGAENLAQIGAQIGADVPFFIYNYPSANVSGIGEVVTPFEEDSVAIETYTPDIRCDTGAVYGRFREAYTNQIPTNRTLAQKLATQSSQQIMQEYAATTLNDLFAPARDLCPALKSYAKEGWFFSGSGSTFFTTGER